MKKIGLAVLLALCIAGVVNAGAIKTWTNEVLLYSDLNSTFAHIHNALRGGSHTLIVNADISSSAAIAHSKLATPALVPKIWAAVLSDCTASPCTIGTDIGVSTITRSAVGEYVVNFDLTRTNNVYGVTVTPFDSSGIRMCRLTSTTTATANISCFDAAAAVDTGFTFVLYDDN